MTEGAVVLREPFLGGLNAPQYQFVDIDGDGDLDLFVRDNDGEMMFFRNEGTALSPAFHFCRGCVSLPSFAFWYRFADLNGDGKPDLCTDDSSSGIRYYVNTGSHLNPAFTLAASTMLDSSGTPVIGAAIGIPAFADLDGDSLLDEVSSNISGSFNYYRNVGTATSPLFKLVSTTFQNIVILGDTCPGPLVLPPAAQKHGGGNMQFADIDDDGTKDMFYGDLFSHGLFMMKNTGTPQTPQFHCVTNRFPDASVVTTGFNQPALVDIDGNGTLDLFMSVLNLMPRHNFWYFTNTGSPSVPRFQLMTQDFIPSIDVGGNAHPAFADLHGNGRQDMCVGTLEGQLWLYRNDGPATSTSFTLVDTNLADADAIDYSYAPAFGDVDGNGTYDLFVGMFDGRILYYMNVGTTTSPAFTHSASPVDTINVGRNASPALIDIDADGDLDLFVGKGDGRISFYRNVFSPAMFAVQLVTPFLDSIDVGDDAVPAFVYNKAHRLYDLVVGSGDGSLWYYENTGDSAHPDFTFRTTTYGSIDRLQSASPAFADIDADGDPDLFVGNSRGGIEYYRNDLVTSVRESAAPPPGVSLLTNFPNPFNPATVIRYSLRGAWSRVRLELFNVVGEHVASLVDGMEGAGDHEVRWDASSFPGGVYYCRLVTGATAATRPIILIK